MDKNQFLSVLQEALWEYVDSLGLNIDTRTFDEVGMLTNDSGIVVNFEGHEYTLTIRDRY